MILDNSTYDNFHGSGDFSHAYVIMHKYFGKNNAKNEYISFYNLTCFLAWKFLAHFVNIWGHKFSA